MKRLLELLSSCKKRSLYASCKQESTGPVVKSAGSYLEVRMIRSVRLLTGICLLAGVGLHGQAKRPLAIEDYYRVLTVMNPQISQDGRSVRFSVTTRIESDNSTKTETFVVPTDRSTPPSKAN